MFLAGGAQGEEGWIKGGPPVSTAGCSEGKGRSGDALGDLLRGRASCLHSSEENMGVGQWFWTSCG